MSCCRLPAVALFALGDKSDRLEVRPFDVTSVALSALNRHVVLAVREVVMPISAWLATSRTGKWFIGQALHKP